MVVFGSVESQHDVRRSEISPLAGGRRIAHPGVSAPSLNPIQLLRSVGNKAAVQFLKSQLTNNAGENERQRLRVVQRASGAGETSSNYKEEAVANHDQEAMDEERFELTHIDTQEYALIENKNNCISVIRDIDSLLEDKSYTKLNKSDKNTLTGYLQELIQYKQVAGFLDYIRLSSEALFGAFTSLTSTAITQNNMELIDAIAGGLGVETGLTSETGFTRFELDQNNPNDVAANWDINNNVINWAEDGSLVKVGNFELPVSCIESAQHIIYNAKQGTAPEDWEQNEESDQNVNLSLSKRVEIKEEPKESNINSNSKRIKKTPKIITRQVNQVVLSLDEEITEEVVSEFESYNFEGSPLELNQGLIVFDPSSPGTSVHAVVVVGKNRVTDQIIVLERNAGTTSGNTEYTDNNWLLNIYDGPDSFYSSMDNDDLIIGKLH